MNVKKLISGKTYKYCANYTGTIFYFIFDNFDGHSINTIGNTIRNGIYTSFNHVVFHTDWIIEEIDFTKILHLYPDKFPYKINFIRKQKIQSLLCL